MARPDVESDDLVLLAALLGVLPRSCRSVFFVTTAAQVCELVLRLAEKSSGRRWPGCRATDGRGLLVGYRAAARFLRWRTAWITRSTGRMKG
jgi:hypothetical protein